MDAKVRAFLYTWGSGRTTAEGEFIPVRVEALELPEIETLLLTPTILEHPIDERSPLHGLTYDHLVARHAEIVVTYEGTSEFGDSFMVRRSYLAPEIHWGHHFVPILQRAGGGELQHAADLSRFHEVVRQTNIEKGLSRSEASLQVVQRGDAQAAGSCPFPQIGSNTLVVSNVCTTLVDRGQTYVLFRVADARPGQMLEAHVRGYLYEWGPDVAPCERFSTPYSVTVRFSPPLLDCSRAAVTMLVAPRMPVSESVHVQEVALGYDTGSDRLLLRYPQVVAHAVNASSPLARWTRADSAPKGRAELVVVAEGVMYATGNNVVRTAVFALPEQLKHNHRFEPMVHDGGHEVGQVVDWLKLHSVVAQEPDWDDRPEAADDCRIGSGQVAG